MITDYLLVLGRRSVGEEGVEESGEKWIWSEFCAVVYVYYDILCNIKTSTYKYKRCKVIPRIKQHGVQLRPTQR